MTPTLVIGIGNPERGDDAAGIEVARRLRARGTQDTEVRECSGDATRLLGSWQEWPRVIMVDAASGGGRPGTVHRFEANRGPLPAALLHGSTHSWGVAEAVEVARSLGQLPPNVVVYAIEGKCFDLARRLSHPVRYAVARVERQILEEIGQIPPTKGKNG